METAEVLRQDNRDALVISAPDSLAWLLNIGGRDLAVAPLALGVAILRADETVSVSRVRSGGRSLGVRRRAGQPREWTTS